MFPRLFHLGNFSLPTYGVMAALGLILGLTVVVRGARREGIDPDRAWNLGIIAILSAMVGSKLLMIINDWGRYSQHPGEIFSLGTLQAAGVFYGGLLAGLPMWFFFMGRPPMSMARPFDGFAPRLSLGVAVGGCGWLVCRCLLVQPTRPPS